MPDKISKRDQKSFLQKLVLQQDTGELSWHARILILVFALALAWVLSVLLPALTEWLISPDIQNDLHQDGTWERILMIITFSVYSLPIFLWVRFTPFFWFRRDTGELNWFARIIILVIALSLAWALSNLLLEITDCLVPSNLRDTLNDANEAWTRVRVTTVYSVPIFLGLWFIRTHDKKIEFKNQQGQLRSSADSRRVESSNHREQLNRSQIEKVVDRLAGEDPVSRGIGVSRLLQLFREERIDEYEYLRYMNICRSWGYTEGKESKKSIIARRANLQDAELGGVDLREANLAMADLTKATLTGATLINADLENADLTGATLINADLENADLTGAILANAKLQGAKLTGTKLQDTQVNDCKMTETQRQLFIAQGVDVSSVTVVDEPSSTVRTQSPPQ